MTSNALFAVAAAPTSSRPASAAQL